MESYEKIIEYQQSLHEKNQKRIKAGIKLVILIPLVFLIIMFRLESSKVVFLVLWILSLFAISAYLISVEYMDYKVQEKLQEWGISDKEGIDGLLNEESRMEDIIRNSKILEATGNSAGVLGLPGPDGQMNNVINGQVEIIDNTALTEAEAELVESIKKYVQAMSANSAQQNIYSAKSAKEYVEMRRARVRTGRTDEADKKNEESENQ